MAGPITATLTWAEIRKAFLDAAGRTGDAEAQAYVFLTEGYRRLLRQVDTPEAFTAEDTAAVGADAEDATEFLDYIPMSSISSVGIIHIDSALNLTDGIRMEIEPAGMPGRDRYLGKLRTGFTRSKPGFGPPRFFVSYADRVYLRPCPSSATTILFRYRTAPAPLTSADLNSGPATPDRFDWAIVYLALEAYLQAHPEQASEQRTPEKYKAAAESLIHEPVQRPAEEEKTAYQRIRLAGYQFSPRSRR
jgi:hypothetical protein